MTNKDTDTKLEELETDLLLEAVFRRYGYDFRDFEAGVVRQRIREGMLAGRVSTISKFQDKLLHQPALLERFLRGFSSTGLSMFSDPGFYRAFRKKVVPRLRTYPFVRIWHTGCSTGEDVYSMAILLQEEGLYQRTRIYATDLSEEVVRQATTGSFRLSCADQYAAAYKESGGTGSLFEYLKKKGNRLVVDSVLKRNIVFSEHNLAVDGSFNEFQVIICRGVLGSFNQKLKERVGRLIYESLSRFGVLALGTGESLEAMPYEDQYVLMDEESRVYQRQGLSGRRGDLRLERKVGQLS